MSHPPALAHGPITRVCDGVHTVRGTYRMAPGMWIGRTMTLIDTGDGLAVLNPVRLDEAGEAELAKLGTVKHLVKVSDSHSHDDAYYVHHFKATAWALEGAKLKGFSEDKRLGPDSPFEGAVVIEYPGTSAWRECAVLVKHGGGTLVTCDAIQNCVDADGCSFVARAMMPVLGFKGGVIVPKVWRKYQKVAGGAVSKALAGLLDTSFANLIAGHGPAAIGGADAAVRAAVTAASA